MWYMYNEKTTIDFKDVANWSNAIRENMKEILHRNRKTDN